MANARNFEVVESADGKARSYKQCYRSERESHLRNVILSPRVTLLTHASPGITIGEISTAAAGAVVTPDVEPYSVYAGFLQSGRKG